MNLPQNELSYLSNGVILGESVPVVHLQHYCSMDGVLQPQLRKENEGTERRVLIILTEYPKLEALVEDRVGRPLHNFGLQLLNLVSW